MQEPDFQHSVPARTAGPQANAPALVQRLIPLDVGNELQTFLHPTNRFIYSPHTIAPELLQPFQAGTKALILINMQNGKALPATLQALHSSYLIADTQHSMFRRKPGDALLVVFPLETHQHYVLRTTIHKVYAFRLELEFQDPRHDVRHTIAGTQPVTLSPVPATIVTALEQNQGRLVRQIARTPSNPHGTIQRLITDVFYPQDIPSPALPSGSKNQALPCVLHDISLGGACLAVNDPTLVDALMHRLVHLTISLPRATQTLPDWAHVCLTLQILGVVRSSSDVTAPKALHIRFLQRLLPEVDSLLWHLEGNVSAGGEP